MDVSDCSEGRVKDAASLMAADPSGAGRESLERIMNAGTSVVGVDGAPSECGNVSSTACFVPGKNSIFINIGSDRGDGSVGTSFTHEGRHVGADQGEFAAISASLNFYDALPAGLRTDRTYNTLSTMRVANPDAFRRIIEAEARRLGQKP